MPFTREGVPFTREGVPFTREGVPFTREGVPFTREGVPFTREGVPSTREGVPCLLVLARPLLPLGLLLRHGASSGREGGGGAGSRLQHDNFESGAGCRAANQKT